MLEPASVERVSYVDADGSEKYCYNYSLVNSSSAAITLGVAGQETWYVVDGSVTVKGKGSANFAVTVLGDVHLILKDDSHFTANAYTSGDGTMRAGIRVEGDNSLTIYGQREQSGMLTATGNGYGAGIGGCNGVTAKGKNITINGGSIEASGTTGIGGAHSTGGQNIHVNRGHVIATGGLNSSGIGNGSAASGVNTSSDIYVDGSLMLRADNSNPPTTFINHDSDTDLSSALDKKRYVIIGGAMYVLNTAWPSDQATHEVTFRGQEYSGKVGDGYFYNAAEGFQAVHGPKMVMAGTLAETECGCSYDYDVLGGTFQKMFIGGELVTEGASSSRRCYIVNLKGGDFQDSVAAGDAVNAAIDVNRKGSLYLNISGGTFAKRVAGGMYYATSGTTGSATLQGDVNFTISGGTFIGRVYGGSNARSDALGGNTSITGSVNLMIDATSQAVTFNEHLVGGSRGAGAIGGDVNMVFKGNGGNLSFDDDSVVFGGSNADYARLSISGVKRTVSSVDGERNLVFDNFTGDFGAELRMFSTASFRNSSNVSFTDGKLDLWAVETWNFEAGSTASGLAANDFAGDTLNFDLGNYDNAPWMVLSGNAEAFDDLENAGSVKFGGSLAHKVYDSGDTGRFLCWTDDNYQLALTADGTALTLSKLAA